MATLVGGIGNDSFLGTADADDFDGSDGFDTISYADAPGAVQAYLDYFGGSPGTAGWGLGDNLRRIEAFIGSAFNDTVAASAQNPALGLAESFTLDGAGGNDFLAASFTNDHLLGGEGNDTLNSGGGFDTLDGGAGFDILTFVYAAAGGVPLPPLHIDLRITTAQEIRPGEFVVLAGIEGVDLFGTQVASDPARISILIGDDAANFLGATGQRGQGDLLQGNGGDDTLYGAGTVEGGAGNDRLRGDHVFGGIGDDIYDFGTQVYLSGPRDIVELRNEGNDTVIMARTANLSEWLNVENLTLAEGFGGIGAAGDAKANRLTGNSADNGLNGSGGNDTLDGGGGTDIMLGGAGRDVFYVESAGDQVIEDPGNGRDRVIASITYALTANVEDLDLAGGALDGTGNILSNRIDGNGLGNALGGGDANDTLNGAGGNDTLSGDAGNDSLSGGSGQDLLIGGAGADQLAGGAAADIFAWTSAADGRDTLVDFLTGVDHLQMSATGFGGGLAAGMSLAATGRFVVNATGRADQGFGQFALETSTGQLFWDADGTGAGARVKIALLGTVGLAAGDFLIVA